MKFLLSFLFPSACLAFHSFFSCFSLSALKGRPWELYDLDADRTETTNLADKYPKLVDKLGAQWRAWANDVGVKDK